MKTICIEDFQSQLIRAKGSDQKLSISKVSKEMLGCKHCTKLENGLYCTLAQEILANIPDSLMQRVIVKKGQHLFRSGDAMNSIYYVHSGYLKSEYVLPSGEYQVNQIVMAGDCLGMDGAASGKHQLDAIAMDECEVFKINSVRLLQELVAQPKLHTLYEKLVSLHLIQMQNHIFSLGIHNAEQKLVYFLLVFYTHDQSSNHDHLKINLPMGREDLASFLGMTIESLSRAFSYLEKNHLLQVNNRLLSNLDVDGLAKLLTA